MLNASKYQRRLEEMTRRTVEVIRRSQELLVKTGALIRRSEDLDSTPIIYPSEDFRDARRKGP